MRENMLADRESVGEKAQPIGSAHLSESPLSEIPGIIPGPSPHPLEELARRVEEGAGSDDIRLCAEIECALPLPDYVLSRYVSASGRVVWVYGSGTHGSRFARDYTSSLDAVVSLLERVLPGWGWAIRNFNGKCKGNVWSVQDEIEFYAPASSPARALLAAVLRALSRSSTENIGQPLSADGQGFPADREQGANT